MMNDTSNPLVMESLRQSEEMLRSQLTIALASDARALNFCGLCLTAASLLTGLADRGSITAGMYMAAAALYVAAWLAGWNAMPVRWYAPGQKGKNLASDIKARKSLDDVASEMVEHNDEQIESNELIRTRQNARLWDAARLAILAAPLGVFVEVAMRLADRMLP